MISSERGLAKAASSFNLPVRNWGCEWLNWGWGCRNPPICGRKRIAAFAWLELFDELEAIGRAFEREAARLEKSERRSEPARRL
jgi:hypothetical protein